MLYLIAAIIYLIQLMIDWADAGTHAVVLIETHSFKASEKRLWRP
jgi:hypothetical protein